MYYYLFYTVIIILNNSFKVRNYCLQLLSSKNKLKGIKYH